MWSYYGAKTKIADLYPVPKHAKIIEPFAGTARYALLHWEKEVLIVDRYERLINIWLFLQQASPKDILSLPQIKAGDHLNKYASLTEVERDLVGFLAGYGQTHPLKKASETWLIRRPNNYRNSLNLIATSLHKIKHWEIRSGSYQDLRNEPATWFIDPPYQHGGRNYAFGNKTIDYAHLSEWSKSREGQVIVCENTKADWLPFNPLKQIQGAQGKSVEAIWSNQKTAFDAIQLNLL